MRRWIFVVLPLLTSSCRACRASDGSATGHDASAATSATGSGSSPALDAAVPYMPSRIDPSASPDEPLSQVEEVLFSLRPQLKECYATASKSDPTLKANITFTVMIGADGTVTDAVPLASPGPIDRGLIECTTRALKSGRFRPPPAGQPASIHVPINFEPPRRQIRPVGSGGPSRLGPP